MSWVDIFCKKHDAFMTQLIKEEVVRRATSWVLLRASIALFGLFLLVFSSNAAWMITYADRVHEGKYLLEEKYGKGIDDIQCEELTSGTALCLVSKDRFETLESIQQTLGFFMNIFSKAAIVFFILSIFSFIGCVWSEANSKKSSHSQPNPTKSFRRCLKKIT